MFSGTGQSDMNLACSGKREPKYLVMRNCAIASAERAELLLVDTSVARNVAIGGWPRKLLFLSGGEILVADRVLGSYLIIKASFVSAATTLRFWLITFNLVPFV